MASLVITAGSPSLPPCPPSCLARRAYASSHLLNLPVDSRTSYHILQARAVPFQRCTWDLIPNAATSRSVFNCDTSEVCILHGSHVCSDPASLTDNSFMHEAKNANHLLQCELEKLDFKKGSHPSRLEMFEALIEVVGQIPASEYNLGKSSSGLGHSTA